MRFIEAKPFSWIFFIPASSSDISRIAFIVAALGGILALSLASVSHEEEQLVAHFTEATHQQVHASVEALTARLTALDQDTRMLTDLVEQEGGDRERVDAATERRVWEGAFRALAVVVPHYRTVALLDAAGSLQVLASDPTETAATVAALIPHTRRLALEVVAKNAKALGQTARYGDRSFLLYGTPVHGGRAIVVASDAAIFLGAVAWTPLPAARLFVTDPAGVVWAGCETSGGCRASPSGPPPDRIESQVAPSARTGVRGARIVGTESTPAVQVSERVDRPTGRWVVTWLASTQRHRGTRTLHGGARRADGAGRGAGGGAGGRAHPSPSTHSGRAGGAAALCPGAGQRAPDQRIDRRECPAGRAGRLAGGPRRAGQQLPQRPLRTDRSRRTAARGVLGLRRRVGGDAGAPADQG